MNAVVRLLRSAPGIGPVAAAVLLAQLPELGRIPPKAIAALAGLAQCHQRLRAGKPPKLALIALARKLLTTLNAIVRQQTPFRQTS